MATLRERILLAQEAKDFAELSVLTRELKSMSRRERMRHLGHTAMLHIKISELRRSIIDRREDNLFPEPEDWIELGDDPTTETFHLPVDNE